MCKIKYGVFAMVVGAILAASACKQDSKADPSLDAWGPDTLTQNAPPKNIPGAQTQQIGSKKIPDRNAPQGESSSGNATQNSGSSGDPGTAGMQSGIQVKPQGKRWWDNRTIFFIDWVGGTEEIVYNAVKGQKYFPETRVFIYATDKAMEGTVNYNKTELTMKETEIDDRIFIWVHLDDARKPVFVKTLISDNIKNKIASAPLQI